MSKITYTGKLRIVIRNGQMILQQEVIEEKPSGFSHNVVAVAKYWQAVEVVNEDEGKVTID